MSESIAEIPSLANIYEASLERQVGIQDTFTQALAPHSAVYILGLEKEIERLKAKADSGAVRLVEDEIANTEKISHYFTDLILGTSIAGEDE
jgi:hypothetical protein